MDKSFVFPVGLALADGDVQLDDWEGLTSTWTVRRTAQSAWVSRKVGETDLPDGRYVQVLRLPDNRSVLKPLT